MINGKLKINKFDKLTVHTGIFNGSKGTVVGFAFTGTVPQTTMPTVASFHLIDDREIPTVFAKMDLKIGYSILSTINSVIPLVAITSENELYNKYYHRWQLPLEPGFACTTHKMQGATAIHGAVVEPSANKPFARGLDYVAVSRPTELANLTLLNPLTTAYFTGFPQERHAINQEYERLQNLYKIT